MATLTGTLTKTSSSPTWTTMPATSVSRYAAQVTIRTIGSSRMLNANHFSCRRTTSPPRRKRTTTLITDPTSRASSRPSEPKPSTESTQRGTSSGGLPGICPAWPP